MLSLWTLALLSCAVSIMQNGHPRPEVALYEATKRFLEALDTAQRKKIGVPFDSEERLNWHYVPKERAGLSYKEMTPAQQRLEALRKAGLENIRFAWMEPLERGKGHYYRIQGPTFLIEYDNTQNNANRIHTVWRDFKGDWGMDLLAHHYRTSPHHTGK